MASAAPLAFGFIKIEGSPEPEVLITSIEPAPTSTTVPSPIDPKDPEGFHKRCSGFNKKTKVRCSAVIGKKSQQNTHPTFLPTCIAHRDQQSFAGWCQFQHPDGERCGRLFRWTPPYFELCSEHQGHPDTPCWFLKLPLELRHEVFRYLLPTKPIGSSTAALHAGYEHGFGPPPPPPPVFAHHAASFIGANPMLPPPPPPPPPFPVPFPVSSGCYGGMTMNNCWGYPPSESTFPMPLVNLLLVNRQIHQETKDLLFSIATFTIDVRRDGTFMCGRRLLEPRRPDGSSHFMVDEADQEKERFLKTFDWTSVKNYAVDILLENGSSPGSHVSHSAAWDEEVELYDIRDYVSVVVSGILAKSKNLCKLHVRLCMSDFKWGEEQIIANTKLIVDPFEKMRNVRQPRISGIFFGRPSHHTMVNVHRPYRGPDKGLLGAPICSVPSLPTHSSVLIPGMPAFDAYRTGWERCMSLHNCAPVVQKPPIRKMFTEFKDFYSKLSTIVPDVTFRNGRHAFLHRARVAREQEDVESFRHLRNELIQYWYAYLEQKEREKNDMNARLSRMLDADVYPSHEWEPERPARRRLSTKQSAQSPILSADSMAKEGIPMTGNSPPPHVLSGFEAARRMAWLRTQPPSQHPQPDMMQHLLKQAQARAATRAQADMQTRILLARAGVRPQDSTPYSQEKAVYKRSALDHTLPVMSEHDDDDDDVTGSNYDLYADPAHDSSHSVADTIMWSNCDSRTNGEPGPSTKRRRVDSGCEEDGHVQTDTTQGYEHSFQAFDDISHVEGSYVGKGKGKMPGGNEVICLD